METKIKRLKNYWRNIGGGGEIDINDNMKHYNMKTGINQKIYVAVDYTEREKFAVKKILLSLPEREYLFNNLNLLHKVSN